MCYYLKEYRMKMNNITLIGMPGAGTVSYTHLIEKAMAETGIPVNVRGEALTLAEFADLANAFNKLR